MKKFKNLRANKVHQNQIHQALTRPQIRLTLRVIPGHQNKRKNQKEKK